MKNFWVVFMLVLFACSDSSSDKKENEVQMVDNDSITSNSIKADDDESSLESLESLLSKLSTEEKRVYNDMLDFIKWYIENRDSLLAKRERIPEVDAKNIAFINLVLLEDYLDFLKNEGQSYLSNQFIKAEDEYWKAAYKEASEKNILWEDGPDPWSFEADPIFYGHEWPDSFEEWKEGQKNEYRELDPSDIKVIGDTAILFFNTHRKLVKEDGKWKLAGWFAEI